MSYKKNRTISYLYQEMDPSERVEFERELLEDENLLIEVESLRTIQQKMATLHTIHPPEEVTEALCSELSRKNRLRRHSQRRNRLLAAAVVLTAFTSLSYLYLYSPSVGQQQTGSEQAVTLGSTGVLLPATTADPLPRSGSSESTVEPWVDSNEVIHFLDRFQPTEATALDSIYHQSIQRLTPVVTPSGSATSARQLQLTGTRR